MIAEDYVSYEVAKLLKEKGFDEYCDSIYILENGDYRHSKINVPCRNSNNYKPTIIVRPTHQMVMKWLREVHNIIIAIRPPYNWNGKKPTNYLFDVWHHCDDNTDNNISVVSSTTYEEAVEAALKYCLTKLI